jgi:Flp pilus assembly protein TadG
MRQLTRRQSNRCAIAYLRREAIAHRLHTAAGERGSLAVEFVILAPLLIGLMLFLVLAGRVVEAHGQVDGAARDAARAASVARSAADAQAAADQAVTDDVGVQLCQPPEVRGYAPGSTAVVVTLHCTVNLTFVSGGTMAVTGYAVAPLDQFVARTF